MLYHGVLAPRAAWRLTTDLVLTRPAGKPSDTACRPAGGYVIIAPEYRGSTGYGEHHYLATDCGGKEVDDTMSAYDYLKTLPHVDPERVGMMGWSHGGYTTLLSLFRDRHSFKAGAAIVPVTNLVFRFGVRFTAPSSCSSYCTATVRSLVAALTPHALIPRTRTK